MSRVLLWESLFLLLLLLAVWSFTFSSKNLLCLLFNSELIIVVLFSWFLIISIFFGVNTLFGLAYLLLIIGGLELALTILILLL